ncbi:MAG: glycerol kinase GlpK [Bryobacterales bacterium]|nr:glycerol kinase GlpK [Bryobacterales bacterium]
MTSQHILSLDEGTSSARAALYDHQGARVAIASHEFPSQYPQPGWVEQDAKEIWRLQVQSARDVLDGARVQPRGLAAVGITNQRETLVVWDRQTGEPIAPAIVWQCRRTSAACAALNASKDRDWIIERTGLVIDPYFTGTKLQWLLDHVPGARARGEAGDLLFGNIDTWLIWKLSGGRVHATDLTNASRTLLMNLATGEWDDDLLRVFNVPRAMLPRIARSSEVVGVTDGDLFGAEVPIAGVAGDQQAATAGQACFSPGMIKNTYGTGCFCLLHTGWNLVRSKNRLITTRAASTNSEAQYAIEGSVFVAGAAIQWLRDSLGILPAAPASQQMAESVTDSAGVYFVPAFVGLGAPHWDSEARGVISGLTRGATAAHIVRAALESIAFQSRELVDAQSADAGTPVKEMRVDGGAARNDFLMQFQADILDCRIVRPADTETTALGAAYLAGLAVGHWKSTEEIASFWRVERVFEPRIAASERARLYDGWLDAVARARSVRR